MHTLYQKLSAAITTLAAFGAIFIAPIVSAQPAAPTIYDFNTSQSIIYTGFNEEVNVDFKISATAYTNVTVEQAGRFIADLPVYGSSSGVWLNPDVNYSTQWDGRDNQGFVVTPGYYNIKINAENEWGTDIDSRSIRVEAAISDPTTPERSIELTDVYVSPTTFDPAHEDTTLNYTLNTSADVRVEVIGDNNYDSVIYNLFNGYQTSGSHSVDWDGRYSDGRIRPEGGYRFRIIADNGINTDSEIRTTYIDYDGSINNDKDFDPRPRISNIDVTPERFNPFNQDTEIEFFLDRPADVIVEIRSSYSDRALDTLVARSLERGTHTVRWDGRDSDGRIVPQDEYRYIIIARNPIGEDIQNGRIKVEHDEDLDFRPRNDIRYYDPEFYDPRYELPRYYDNNYDPYRPIPRSVRSGYECAGFADVREGGELCDAVAFVRDMEIFNGYSDGLFRPDQPINRAEVTKVILKGFNIRIVPPTGTTLSFADVDPNAWYMPFVRTAKRLGIVQGYPNGEFAPNQTMNRAELLKVFLMTSGKPVPSCINSPYADTPNEPKTHWYIDYVCFSKQHGLMNDTFNGRFDPAMPITRGDVAVLFYRFHKKGFLADSLSYAR